MKDSPTVDARASIFHRTPLMQAVEEENIEDVKSLLEAKANPNATYAINQQIVFENWDRIERISCFSVLQLVSSHKDTKIAEMLLKHKAQLNLPGTSDSTVLHSACARRNGLIANFLVDNGADTNIKCKDIDGTERPPAYFWVREDDLDSITEDGRTTELAPWLKENRPQFMQGI